MPRRYIVAYDFLIFADICVTFCELSLWEICIPRIVQVEEILIGCFVECQSIKKVGSRCSVEEFYQALFFFRPSPLNFSPSETNLEPDRRLGFSWLFFQTLQIFMIWRLAGLPKIHRRFYISFLFVAVCSPQSEVYTNR